MELADGQFKAAVKSANESLKGVGEATKGSNRGLRGLGESAKASLSSVTGLFTTVMGFKAVSAVMGMVKNSISSAFARIDTMDQFQQSITRMTGDSKAAEKALDSLKGITKGTAYGMDVAAKATQNFVTRGMGVKDATKSVGVWADAVAMYGKGTNEQLAGVTDAIGKMRTKGKVEMDQLNTLFDAGIDAVGMYGKAHNMSANDVQAALSKGSISADDFLKTVENGMATGEGGILKIAGAAKEAGSSWKGSFDNMKAATTRGMVGIITSIEEGLSKINLPTMKESLSIFGKFLETTMTSFGNLLGVTFSKIGEMIKFFEPQIKMIKQWFTETFTGVGEESLPIFTTVIETIKGFIDGLVQFWTDLFNGENGLSNSFSRMFTVVKDIATPILEAAMDTIKSIISSLTQFWAENGQNIIYIVQTVWSTVAKVFETVMPVLKDVTVNTFNMIKEIISAVMNAIGGIIKVITGIMKGDMSLAWEGIKQITVAIWSGIQSYLDGLWNNIKSMSNLVFGQLKEELQGIWNRTKQSAETTWNNVKDAMLHPIEWAKDKISKIVETIKDLFDFELKFPEIEIPHIPMPHFSMSGEFSLSPPSIPSIGVDWYQTAGVASKAREVFSKGIGKRVFNIFDLGGVATK